MMRRKQTTWLKRFDAIMRRMNAAGQNDQVISERLGISRGCVSKHRRRSGLPRVLEHRRLIQPLAGHDSEIQSMHAAGKLDREIARALGVTRRRISLRRVELGLPALDKNPMYALAPFDDVIREKLAAQWSDSEIAAEIGAERRSVGMRRVFLGLPASGNSPRRRAKVSDKTREQCRRAGVKSLGELRSLAYANFARENGWPAELSPRCVQVLELLLRNGFMIRRDIVAAVYRRVPTNPKKWLFDNGSRTGGANSILAILMRYDLVVRSPRFLPVNQKPNRRGNHQGQGVHLYGPSLKARRMKEVWLAQRAKGKEFQNEAASDGAHGAPERAVQRAAKAR